MKQYFALAVLNSFFKVPARAGVQFLIGGRNIFLKFLLVLFFFVTAFLKLEAGEPDTLWTKQLPEFTGGCKLLKYNFDETQVIIGTSVGLVYILDASSGNILDSIKTIYPRSGDDEALYDYANVNGKNTLLYSSGDSLMILNMDSKQIENVIKDTVLDVQWPYYGNRILNVCISSIKKQISITYGTRHRIDSSGKMIVHIFDLNSNKIIKSIFLGRGDVYSGSLYSPDGNMLAIYSNKYLTWKSPLNFGIDFYDTKTWENLGRINYDSTQANYFTFSPDGLLLATSFDNSKEMFIRVWDVETKSLKYKLTTKKNNLYYRIFSPCFTSDSKKIFFGNAEEVSNNEFKYHLFLYDSELSRIQLINETLFDFLFRPNPRLLNKVNNQLLGFANKYFLLDISQLLSVNDFVVNSYEVIFPNPSTGNVTINFYNPMIQEIGISIIADNGVILKNISLGTFDTGSQIITENISYLFPGNYFIRLTGKSFSKTFKLIKEK